MRSLGKSAYALILLQLVFLYTDTSAWAATSNDSISDKISHAISVYTSGNYDQALDEFLPLARQGNAESQYYTGLIYCTDGWSKRDPSLALTYLLSAADQNYTPAMWQIGQLYNNGDGVKKDILVALDWYRKSERMELKPPIPQIVKVHDGIVSPYNWPEEIQALKTQATNGNIEAQYKLASVYDRGILVPEDKSNALYWYLRAANNGHNYSMIITGYFLCRGLAGNTDTDEANQWLQKSGSDVLCVN